MGETPRVSPEQKMIERIWGALSRDAQAALTLERVGLDPTILALRERDTMAAQVSSLTEQVVVVRSDRDRLLQNIATLTGYGEVGHITSGRTMEEFLDRWKDEWRPEPSALVASLTEQNERLTRERDELKVSHAEYVFARMQTRAAELEVARLTQEKAEALADVTDWILIADGIKHDPRCSNHFMGNERLGPCWRCREEAAEARNVQLEAALREIVTATARWDKTGPIETTTAFGLRLQTIARAALASAGRAPEAPTT